MNPLDPIGSRRCPQCQSVKARQEDECWYCNPEHFNKELEKAVAEIVKDRGPELVAGIEAVAAALVPSRTKTKPLPPQEDRPDHVKKIEELCLRISALQSTDLIGDAYQLVKYCRTLLKENQRLHEFRSAAVQCAKDHGEAAADYEEGGNADGAARLRAVQNLLWRLIYDAKGEVILPWERKDG